MPQPRPRVPARATSDARFAWSQEQVTSVERSPLATRALGEEASLNGPDNDKAFTGSIAAIYEEYLVPLIFEPYAVDLAHRHSAPRSAGRLLL